MDAISLSNEAMTKSSILDREKRKRLLKTLLDALVELQNEEELEAKPDDLDPQDRRSPPEAIEKGLKSGAYESPQLEKGVDATCVSAELVKPLIEPKKGDDFLEFVRQMNDMVSAVHGIANGLREYSSTVGVPAPAFHVRELMLQLLSLFCTSAGRADQVHVDLLSTVRKRLWADAATFSVQIEWDVERLPDLLMMLAQRLDQFASIISNISELADNRVLDGAIGTLCARLKYWGASLAVYKGQLSDPPLQALVHDLALNMIGPLEDVNIPLSVFLKTAIPNIQASQRNLATNLLTLATFFSAVSATTLQFSFPQKGRLDDAVNAFWFSSLTLSVASIVNSLLGLTWKMFYRSPRRQVPWWIQSFLKDSPLIFLVGSVAAFSVGLCVFSFASGQHLATSSLTSVFTSANFLALFAVAIWVAFHDVKAWFAKYLLKHAYSVINRIKSYSGFRRTTRAVISSYTVILSGTIKAAGLGYSVIRRVFAGHGCSQKTLRATDAYRSAAEPVTALARPISVKNAAPDRTALTPASELGCEDRKYVAALDTSHQHTSVVKSQLESLKPSSPFSLVDRKFIREIAFSPDGLYLAISGLVETMLSRVQDLANPYSTLHHDQYVQSISWSPNAGFIAVISEDSLEIFNRETGERRSKIQVETTPMNHAGPLAWLAQGEGESVRAALRTSVADIYARSSVHGHLQIFGDEDIAGKLLDSYPLDGINLARITVTPDNSKMLLLASLKPTDTKTHLPRVVQIGQIIVYDIESKKFESRYPALAGPWDIILARRADVVLVSYHNKSPQLLQLSTSSSSSGDAFTWLALQTTFHRPDFQKPVFASSSFGGRYDEFVIQVESNAHCDVHVWNRSGDLLHHTQIYAMSRKAVSAYMPIHLAVNRNDSLLKFCTSSSEVGVEFQIRLWEVSSLETVAVSIDFLPAAGSSQIHIHPLTKHFPSDADLKTVNLAPASDSVELLVVPSSINAGLIDMSPASHSGSVEAKALS